MIKDTRVCSSDQAKAEAFGGHCESVFNKESLEDNPSMPASPSDMPGIYFSSPGILKQLGAIKPDKACGPD